MKTSDRFNDVVSLYDKYRPSYNKNVLNFINKYVNMKNKTILDLGSGTGILTNQLKLFNPKLIYAVEPNDLFREISYNKFTNIKIPKIIHLNGSSKKIPCNNNSVDVIFIAQAFHWFEPISMKKEFKRVLKKKGYLVVINNIFFKEYCNEINKAYDCLKEKFNYNDNKSIKYKNNILMFNNNYHHIEETVKKKITKDQFVNLNLSQSNTPPINLVNEYNFYKNKLIEIFDKFAKNKSYITTDLTTFARIVKI